MIRQYDNHGPGSAGYDKGPLENGDGQQSDKGTPCFHGPEEGSFWQISYGIGFAENDQSIINLS